MFHSLFYHLIQEGTKKNGKNKKVHFFWSGGGYGCSVAGGGCC